MWFDIYYLVLSDSNKKKIVDVLAKNCADKSRLDKLSGKYQKKYKKDMRKEIKPLMEEGVQKALDSMLAPNAERDAKRLNDAMKVKNYKVSFYKWLL